MTGFSDLEEISENFERGRGRGVISEGRLASLNLGKLHWERIFAFLAMSIMLNIFDLVFRE